jgi:hypothetical protein
VLGEQGQQRREPGRVVADAAAGQQLPVPVGQGDVVVIFGPVDPAVNLRPFPPFSTWSLFLPALAARGTHAP